MRVFSLITVSLGWLSILGAINHSRFFQPPPQGVTTSASLSKQSDLDTFFRLLPLDVPLTANQWKQYGHLVNQRNREGVPPLLYALGWKQTREDLLVHGASIRSVDTKGYGALHYLALPSGPLSVPERVRLSRRLFSKGAFINLRDKLGSSPLHIACRCGEVDVAVALIDMGADVNAQTNVGKTPLMEIASLHTDHIDTLFLGSALIRRGARTNALDFTGRSALDYAISNQNSTLADMIKSSSPR